MYDAAVSPRGHRRVACRTFGATSSLRLYHSPHFDRRRLPSEHGAMPYYCRRQDLQSVCLSVHLTRNQKALEADRCRQALACSNLIAASSPGSSEPISISTLQIGNILTLIRICYYILRYLLMSKVHTIYDGNTYKFLCIRTSSHDRKDDIPYLNRSYAIDTACKLLTKV